MKNAALAVALLSIPAARAAAEPGRYAALKSLAAALPEKSASDDPAYLDAVAGFGLPDQLAACRWGAEETAAVERLVRLFDKYLTPTGGGKDALLKAIGQLPDFADRAHDKRQEQNYAKLSLGIRLAPDITKAHLVNAACKTLLKTHFENGASRAQLAAAIDQNKAALDAAPAPKD